MAISTRSRYYATVKDRSEVRKEASTPAKTKFYDALDRDSASKSFRQIARETAPSYSTACRWKKDRIAIGSPSYRRLRTRSAKLGRPPIINPSITRKLIDPAKNPVRDQTLEAQLEFHNIHAHPKTLTRALLRDTKKGRKYKQAYVKKKLSVANKEKRVRYGNEHLHKSIDEFWSHIFFTDEAHIDPSATAQGWILREQGTRYDEPNIEERSELSGNKLHFAAWVNWYSKAEKLEFYHDEEESTEQPKRPPKPRKRMYEEPQEFDRRIAEWNALLPHKVSIKPKGNSMTQKYYTERLLPVYITTIQQARFSQPYLELNRTGDLVDWWLQEDNDGSHGHGRPSQNTERIQPKGLATNLKEDNWISTLDHPPQSPDLNPIEGIWCILKQRARRYTWNTLDELKEILQEEWNKITLEEVRERIAEMPERCQRLVNTGGAPIKGAKW